jgi:Kef-type K+ transport system membrane component KefB
VDRIIDSHDNEYVLSSSRDAAATLTLDPQFVQDLTFILTTAAIMGMVFEALQQPVINGYLVAGAILGPGGFALIKELVQVESLAQLGVQLLLFGLGRELSVSRFKAVWGVSLIGGSLQLLALMLLGGVLAALLTSNVPQGVFIGCLLSMSSTSVVVKCLEVTKATGSAYGQITIGTLILQDCSVGLLFALMPAFAPAASTVMGGAGGAGRAMAAAMEGGMDAGVTAAEGSSSSDAAVLAVLMLIIGVVLKLVVMLVVAVVLARTLLPFALQLMMKHCSSELVQLSLVGICLSCAWLSGHLRLSEELGAFISGAMISMAERALILKGSPLSPIHRGSSCSGGPNEAGYGPSPASAAVAYAAVATSGPAAAAAQAVQPLEGPHGHHSGLTGNIDSIINVLTALFVASVGLIMSPVFLWHHLWVLLAGTLVVMVVKAFVVAAVVHMFGTPIATSCAVGLTMAHIGEFSFVLLSMASQLKLLSPQVRAGQGVWCTCTGVFLGRASRGICGWDDNVLHWSVGGGDGIFLAFSLLRLLVRHAPLAGMHQLIRHVHVVCMPGLPPPGSLFRCCRPGCSCAPSPLLTDTSCLHLSLSVPVHDPRLLTTLLPLPPPCSILLQLYMLLLGVTAMSLLTTPPIIMLAGRLLQQEAHGAGCNLCGGWGSRRLQQQRSGLPVANGNGSSSSSSEKAPLRGTHSEVRDVQWAVIVRSRWRAGSKKGLQSK